MFETMSYKKYLPGYQPPMGLLSHRHVIGADAAPVCEIVKRLAKKPHTPFTFVLDKGKLRRSNCGVADAAIVEAVFKKHFGEKFTGRISAVSWDEPESISLSVDPKRQTP